MHCGTERFPTHENPAPAHMLIGNPLRDVTLITPMAHRMTTGYPKAGQLLVA